MKMKVLIVDDTILYRKILKDILDSMPDIEVVGSVSNGKLALARIQSLKPDLMTLDVEMPVMNGLEVLEALKKDNIDIGCIMVSSKTQEGSEATIRALELGAFDFIEKPDEDSTAKNIARLQQSLSTVIKAFALRMRIRQNLYGKGGITARPAVKKPTPESTSPAVPSRPKPAFKRTEKSSVIAIGVSTGGPNALMQVLPKLPQNIGVPVLLVQHMPPVFSASLAKSLDKKCALRVKEAEDGDPLEADTVYVAKGGQQMKVASGADLKKIIRLTDDPPENNCKPAVDYLLRSVSREYGSKATCVIMTGMGSDGKLGVTLARAGGAISIAQNAETCVVYGMPKAIIDAGLADIIAPLDALAEEIMKTIR